MNKTKRALGLVGIALILAISTIHGTAANAGHVLTVDLRTAAPFAILAGTPNITNVPTSTISGNVGLSPATGAGIGLTCGEVTGTIYSVDATGPLPCRVTNPGLLTIAKSHLDAAITDAAGRPGGLPVAANDLAGKTLTHGVYKSAAAMGLLGGGTVILDGQNNPNSVFIFQLGTLLTVSNASTVTLTNQAQSCNVFWQVDSAVIGSTATFRGTVLARTSITVGNGTTVDGRLLAHDGNVTLISDTIIKPTCAAPPVNEPPDAATPVPPPAATATPTPAPTATPRPAATVTPAPAPTATPAPAATATPAPAATAPARLPATSTDDPVAPLTLLVLLLAGIGFAVLRSPVRRS